MQRLHFNQCQGGDWVTESIPLDQLIPSFSFQEQKMIDFLSNNDCVQGFSSNIEGDRTYMDSVLVVETDFPLKEDHESLPDYCKRVFGHGVSEDQLSEGQREARDKLANLQINKEWKTMYAYHYPNFITDSSKYTPSVKFDTSLLRRKAEEQNDEIKDESGMMKSFKRTRV